jgi:hypothetical protein
MKVKLGDIKRLVREATLTFQTPFPGELDAGLDAVISDVKKSGRMSAARTIKIGERMFVIELKVFERRA